MNLQATMHDKENVSHQTLVERRIKKENKVPIGSMLTRSIYAEDQVQKK